MGMEWKIAAHNMFDETPTSIWIPPSRVLEVTILRVRYPITEKVLRQVFAPFGVVEEVYVCEGSARVVFQSRHDAVEAFGELHARNIYDGCCQMVIQYGSDSTARSSLTLLQVSAPPADLGHLGDLDPCGDLGKKQAGFGGSEPAAVEDAESSSPSFCSDEPLDEGNGRDAEAEAEYTNGPHDVPFVRSVPDNGFTCDFLLRMLHAGSTAGADAALLRNLEVRAKRRLIQATLGAVLMLALERGEHPGGSALLLNVPLVMRILNWDPGVDVVVYIAAPGEEAELDEQRRLAGTVLCAAVQLSQSCCASTCPNVETLVRGVVFQKLHETFNAVPSDICYHVIKLGIRQDIPRCYSRALADIVARCWDHFIHLITWKHGKDISKECRALGKLRRECERAKCALSSQHQVRVEIETLFDGVDFSEQLTRAKFKELNMDLLFIHGSISSSGLWTDAEPQPKDLTPGYIAIMPFAELQILPGNIVRQFYINHCMLDGVGVMLPDGYMEIRDRSQDVIISGVEVESVLYGHPAVNEVAAAHVLVVTWCFQTPNLFKCKYAADAWWAVNTEAPIIRSTNCTNTYIATFHADIKQCYLADIKQCYFGEDEDCMIATLLDVHGIRAARQQRLGGKPHFKERGMSGA